MSQMPFGLSGVYSDNAIIYQYRPKSQEKGLAAFYFGAFWKPVKA